MATVINAGLMIEWGMPKDGREFKALEEFAAQVKWYDGLKRQHRIEDFSTFGTLQGNYTRRSGFVLIVGSRDQIRDLHHDEAYRTNLNRVMAVVNNVRVTTLETGDEMVARLQRFGGAIKAVVG